MPREMVTIQVGQCGNQIGCRFWELAMREHLAEGGTGAGERYDEAMSSFFANEPPESDDAYARWRKDEVGSLRARAVLVDMEEGVVNRLQRMPSIGPLFDNRLCLTDVSGSGNNWAHGYMDYGRQYSHDILDRVRQSVEACSSPQSFVMLHSLGGGTGSGFGSFILESLETHFPELCRLAVSVFPSEDDDVVTSPYNAVLAADKLVEHADCVFPIDNQQLIAMCDHIDETKRKAQRPGAGGLGRGRARPSASRTRAAGANDGGGGEEGGDRHHRMNGIAAKALLDLTASVRFEGTLNMDLGELPMNAVPYPKLHFLGLGVSPLVPPPGRDRWGGGGARQAGSRALSDMDKCFTDAHTSPVHQLMRPTPAGARPRPVHLASALLTRGEAIRVSDVERNVRRLAKMQDSVYWVADSPFKVGLCR